MNKSILELKDFAKFIRISALKMTSNGGSSHIGSIFSIADILSYLYGSYMNVLPENPLSEDRDRFILSKGHAGAGVYSALAYCGFFSEELLSGHYKNGTVFSGHVSHKGVPGVEFSTGSLGHGLSVASGISYALKSKGNHSRVICLMSDGECDEGSNWEAFLFAAHHKLSNLIAIVDYNKLQSLTSTEDTLALEPFTSKLESFGWHVINFDGHDFESINNSFKNLSSTKPNFLIAHTTKGKGVSFMENNVLWHYRTAKGIEFDSALEELINA